MQIFIFIWLALGFVYYCIGFNYNCNRIIEYYKGRPDASLIDIKTSTCASMCFLAIVSLFLGPLNFLRHGH